MSELQNIINYYDAIANGYDELYGSEQIEKYKQLKVCIKKFQGIIADIGCGTAIFLEYLSKVEESQSFYYLCVDASRGMLSKAKQKHSNKLVDIIQAVLPYLPLRDNCCNIVVSITVIRVLDVVDQFLGELIRICKGDLAVSILGVESIEEDVLSKGFRFCGLFKHEALYTLECTEYPPKH